MTTRKQSPASRKSVTPKTVAAKRITPKASKKISKKTSVKPAAKKRVLPAKTSSKVTSSPSARHDHLAKQALGFLDEAASLLRAGILEGSKSTQSSRIIVKKKAHNLLGKAAKNLSKAIEDGASSLQDLIKKI